MIEDAIRRLPPDVIAHRLGDFVFTYHGIDPNAANGSLWLIIGSPDPDGQPYSLPGGEIWIGRADGVVIAVAIGIIDNALKQQNELRRAEGLPELPHPSEITHNKPAPKP